MSSCCGLFRSSCSKDERPFSCNSDRLVGLIALVVGVALVVISTVLASGLYGGGTMYFVAAAVVAGSILPFSVAAYLLFNPIPRKAE